MRDKSQTLKVYQQIRKKVLAGELVIGSRLTEETWAKIANVSRNAVREALMRLLGEGLVESGKRGGYFVALMKPEDFHDISRLRTVLELGALRLAMQKITKSQIHTLEEICNDFRLMAGKGYLCGASEADIRFHETLITYSGNTRLAKTYLHSHIPLFHQRVSKSQQSRDDHQLSDKEHRLIVSALRDKDLATGEKILSKHLARMESVMLGGDVLSDP